MGCPDGGESAQSTGRLYVTNNTDNDEWGVSATLTASTASHLWNSVDNSVTDPKQQRRDILDPGRARSRTTWVIPAVEWTGSSFYETNVMKGVAIDVFSAHLRERLDLSSVTTRSSTLPRKEAMVKRFVLNDQRPTSLHLVALFILTLSLACEDLARFCGDVPNGSVPLSNLAVQARACSSPCLDCGPRTCPTTATLPLRLLLWFRCPQQR